MSFANYGPTCVNTIFILMCPKPSGFPLTQECVRVFSESGPSVFPYRPCHYCLDILSLLHSGYTQAQAQAHTNTLPPF